MDLKEKITPYRKYLPYIAVFYLLFLIILSCIVLFANVPLIETNPPPNTLSIPPIFLLGIMALVPFPLLYALVSEILPNLQERYEASKKLITFFLLIYLGYLMVLFFLFLTSGLYNIPIEIDSGVNPVVIYGIAVFLPIIITYALRMRFIRYQQIPSDYQGVSRLPTPSDVQRGLPRPLPERTDNMRYTVIFFSLISLIGSLLIIVFCFLAEIQLNVRYPWSWSDAALGLVLLAFIFGLLGLTLSLASGIIVLLYSLILFFRKTPFKRFSNKRYFVTAIPSLICLLLVLTTPFAIQIRINDIHHSYKQIILKNDHFETESFLLTDTKGLLLGKFSFKSYTTYMLAIKTENQPLPTQKFSISVDFVNTSTEKALDEPFRDRFGYHRGKIIPRESIMDSTPIDDLSNYFYVITNERLFLSSGEQGSFSEYSVKMNLTLHDNTESSPDIHILFIEDSMNIIKKGSLEIFYLKSYDFIYIPTILSSCLIIISSLIFVLKDQEAINPSPRLCSHCGAPLKSRYNFCASCGAKHESK